MSYDRGEGLLEWIDPYIHHFPRFRSARIDLVEYYSYEEGNLALIVTTRAGGGNREEYQSSIDEISRHQMCFAAEDDPTDQTYCDFYFYIPEKYHQQAEEMFRVHSRTPDRKIAFAKKWTAEEENCKPEPIPETYVDREECGKLNLHWVDKR
jgi:hypothetical protein